MESDHFHIAPTSAPYDYPCAPAGHAKRMISFTGDRQPSSAARCAELVWQVRCLLLLYSDFATVYNEADIGACVIRDEFAAYKAEKEKG